MSLQRDSGGIVDASLTSDRHLEQAGKPVMLRKQMCNAGSSPAILVQGVNPCLSLSFLPLTNRLPWTRQN